MNKRHNKLRSMLQTYLINWDKRYDAYPANIALRDTHNNPRFKKIKLPRKLIYPIVYNKQMSWYCVFDTEKNSLLFFYIDRKDILILLSFFAPFILLLILIDYIRYGHWSFGKETLSSYFPTKFSTRNPATCIDETTESTVEKETFVKILKHNGLDEYLI